LSGTLAAILSLPLILEKIPGGFSTPPISFKSFPWLYTSHELRRSSTWITLLFSSSLLCLASTSSTWGPWAQVGTFLILPLRALYSIQMWRHLAYFHCPRDEVSRKLVKSFALSQSFQVLILICFHFIFMLLSKIPVALSIQGPIWWAGSMAAVLSTGFCLEGDSGRPWLVHLVTLSAGITLGFFIYRWPILSMGGWYVWDRAILYSARRSWVVENFDEDTIIS
jgi:hypothetical protein